jgi:phospholipid transport system substrate-binding protein
MDFQKTEPGIDGSETSLHRAAEETAPSAGTGLPPGVSEVLADPIVKALMVADRVDPQGLKELLQRASATLAMLAKGFVLVLAVIVGLSAASASAAADGAPIAFIRALGDQAVSVLRSDMPPTTKAAYFDQMVRQDFDLTGIARFVLGPYWRAASPAERQQFCEGFANRLVRIYGRQLEQSSDGDFGVTGSRTVPGGVIVTSRIVRPQGAPIAVDWRLEIRDGVYKIEDVTIDGVSMALAQRSEIAALIARGSGQVAMLIEAMR